ncbi:MAG: alpha/beta hydrolase [Bdellovibrionales bacterium]|nr:alpha/beta hydrolase [Bdellovibrionales bacterium]
MKLVLVHGFLGSAINWGPIVSRLKQDPFTRDWDVRAVELLGHGRRGLEALPRPLTQDAVAEDLERQLPDGPMIAVGHSFGLRPLLKIAGRHPEKFLRLIAEDSSPVLSGPGLAQLLLIFDGIETPFATREAAKLKLDSLFGAESAMAKFLLSNIREIREGVHDWRFQRDALRELLLDARDHALWTDWERYSGPISMILGANSDYVPAVRLEECLRRRPGKVTEAVHVPNAGHWVHSEQPAQFIQELVSILKRV